MADDAQTIRSINWRDVFPFTNIFKAFRVAVHPSKLVLALTALLLIYFGGRLLDVCWPKTHLVQPYTEMWRPNPHGTDASPRGIFISFFDFEVDQVNSVTRGVLYGNWVGGDIDAVGNFFIKGPAWLLTHHWVFFFIFAIWFMLIWSVFGGAISRIAAVHVARDEKISVRQAVRFSVNKLLSFVFAPLIPLLILFAIGAILALAGTILFHIKYIGSIVAGALFILALVAGLVMALVLLGLVGGFNLMYPTIAVEGSDSFDAISRSFSYVFVRPWRMLFYTLVAIVYGALTYLFVRFFIWLVLTLTRFFVGWWVPSNSNAGRALDGMWPGPGGDFRSSLVYSPNYESLKGWDDVGAGLISIWVYLAIGLLGAYAISYYFSAQTIIYYLMRREVDATELEDVYVEETEDEFGEPVGAVVTPAGVEITTTTVAVATTPATPSTSAPGGSVAPESQTPTTPDPDAPTS